MVTRKKKQLAYLQTLKHTGTFVETRHLHVCFWPNAYLALEWSLHLSSPYFRKNDTELMWNLPISNKRPPPLPPLCFTFSSTRGTY